MLRHLTAAIPRQPPPQACRQRTRWLINAAASVGLVPVGQRDNHRVAGGTVNQGGDCRWARSEHEITLPMAGYVPGVGLGRPLADGDHVPDLTASVRTLLSARPSDRMIGAQTVDMLASNTFREGIYTSR